MSEGDEWVVVEFEVALDSGCTDHVCDEIDCPGYLLEESPGSSAGKAFTIGDGKEIPNRGQKALRLEDCDVKGNVTAHTVNMATDKLSMTTTKQTGPRTSKHDQDKTAQYNR